MKSKRKIIISILIIAFVVMSVLATIAIVFALTQQTVKTSLNINYQATQVSAKVSASVIYADGTEESMITPNGNASSITFKADDTPDPNGSTLIPLSAINLTSSEKYVVFKYTFENTGGNQFVATFDYLDTETEDSNMTLSYSTTGEDYKPTLNSLLVEGLKTKSYYIKLEINNVSFDAEFSGAISWVLNSDIIVATPETAQSILDSNINDKTIVFKDGSYDTKLYLRASRETSLAYLWDAENSTRGEAVADPTTIPTTTYLVYTRDISNVTFLATEDAIFTSQIVFDSRKIWNLSEWYDVVRDKATNNFYQQMKLTNVTFNGLTFEGENGRITMKAASDDYSEISNIEVSNCSFKTTSIENPEMKSGAILVETTNGEKLNKGFVIKNNHIEGHYKGFDTRGIGDVTIVGNTFKNLVHHGVTLLSYATTAQDRGFITITGNTFDTCWDTAAENNNDFYNYGQYGVRLQYMLNTEITISNNNFKNVNKQMIKGTTMNNCTYTFTNNYYDGEKVADTSGVSAASSGTVEILRPAK